MVSINSPRQSQYIQPDVAVQAGVGVQPVWRCRSVCLALQSSWSGFRVQLLGFVQSAVWRRKPKPGALVHSDQGSVYTSDDWQRFLAAHGLACSMSRRGNCHDNAPVESFFGLLKRERIRRRIDPSKDAARADAFDYIEMFYNPKRRQGSNGDLSPVEFERRYAQRGS